MNEATDTEFASLSPSLLARKGGARPAMRPQLQPLSEAQKNGPAPNLEDLGWNDMGDAAEAKTSDSLPLTPAPPCPEAQAEAVAVDQAEEAKLNGHAEDSRSEVRRQQKALEERIAKPLRKPTVTLDVKPEPQAAAPVQDLAQNLARREAQKDRSREEAAEMQARAPAPPRKRRANGTALRNGKRAAFTLRLDAERHLKLRLASTVRNLSAQQIVTEALDKVLKDIPELDTLAKQVAKQ